MLSSPCGGVIDAVKAKYFITKKDCEGLLELYANDSDMDERKE